MQDEHDSKEAMELLLRKLGWIRSSLATLSPMTGGISSEIYLVRDGSKRFVVKRPLPKLKVESAWYADTTRNHSEQAYIRYVGLFRPDGVPKILHTDKDEHVFAMEYLDGYENWKSALLSGIVDPGLAYQAGRLLGEIHARSWNDLEVKSAFDTIPNFDQLRIDPYLRTTASKHPKLRQPILAEADRLMHQRSCLMHGDFSPKNILFKGRRLVALDCEVACFADPAFDLSFFLNHLFLKCLYHGETGMPLVALIDATCQGYREGLPIHWSKVERDTARLLPMLMLARVDGKSPVEYLNAQRQKTLREFATVAISNCNYNLDTLKKRWLSKCINIKPHEN